MTKRFANRFFRWFCHPDYYDEIKGDLEELYQRDAERNERSVQWKYLFRVLTLLRPSLIRSFPQLYLTNPAMFRHYFRISTRVLLRHKFYTAINVLGLAVGMGIALLIYQYIHFELSYDRFHPGTDHTYRLTQTAIKEGEIVGEGVDVTWALGPRGKETIPEVLDYVRVQFQEVGMVLANPTKNDPFQEDNIWFADSNFFQMFNFPLTYGNPKLALAEKRNIVITQPMATKYFGEADPYGEVLRISGGWASGDYIVRGVLAPLPSNSHLRFDFLLPMQLLLEEDRTYQEDEGWVWENFTTYVQLNESANLATVASKFDRLIDANIGEKLARASLSVKTGFQPLVDIHLKSDHLLGDFSTNNGDIQDIQFFALIAAFILVMAWVNYINLSTARAMHRAKEVGVRKSVGALKGQLMGQFITESLLINSLAAVLSVGIAFLALPLLNDVIGEKLSFSVLYVPEFWGIALLVIVFGALLSGLYPALVLSSFKAIRALQLVKMPSRERLSLRKGLIVFQFVISALLISGTYLVHQQIAYMKNQNLGFNAEEILVVNGPRVILDTDRSSIASKQQIFKNSVLNNHSVTAVSATSQIPGKGYIFTGSMRKRGNPVSSDIPANALLVDATFTDVYDFTFLAGEPFTAEMPEREWVIINEEAVKAFGLGSPARVVGQELVVSGFDTLRIQGVTKNVHWSSLKDAHLPVLFWLDHTYGAFFSIKMNLSDIPETIAHIESAYRATFPDDPFAYFFLDDSFNQQYQADVQFGNLFSIFSVLAIFIACIGLFALVSYSATLRTKEIGIRKVLGATVGNLMLLLSREYLVLLLIAIALAVPVILIGGKAWLNNYAFKTDIGIDLLVIPASVLVLISVLTVSYRTYATANRNPADSLRTE